MMRNCADLEALARSWDEGGTVEATELASFREHIGTCAACRKRHGLVLSLMERDAAASTSREPSGAAMALADTVMGALFLEGSPEALPILRPPRSRWRLPTLAAAAAALLALAFTMVAPRLFQPSDRVLVRFVIVEPKASTVSLAGDFTGWKTEGYSLRPDAQRRVWEIDIPLERGKIYLYNFVVDGTKWVGDPAAVERVDDGFGGSSALLRL
ncbi:MAG TPA: hypothetical protein VMV44_16420 [Rectinemataceae bacterium]|nr:hypothetical protein [Rectinemataceae bacterium]